MEFNEYMKVSSPLRTRLQELKDEQFRLEARQCSIVSQLIELNKRCCGDKIDLPDGHYAVPEMYGQDGDCYLTIYHTDSPAVSISCFGIKRYPDECHAYDYTDNEYVQKLVDGLPVTTAIKEELVRLVLRIILWMHHGRGLHTEKDFPKGK